jgi:hypothetical protein
MTNFGQAVFVIGLALVLAAPAVLAHGPPAAPEYQTRLLADCVDDYFGGDGVGDKNGHDVISLDVQEQYDDAFSTNVLRFRLTLNGGFAGSGSPVLTDHIHFTTPSGARSYYVQTTDNKAFTTTFDRVDPPKPLLVSGAQDGTRFYVDAVIKWSTLGVSAGQKLTQFRVESFIDATRGDYMPGTYDGDLLTPTCKEEAASGAPYGPVDLGIRGPSQYAKLTPSANTVSLVPGGARIVPIDLDNLLKRTAQSFTLTVEAPAGVGARFHDAVTNQYTTTGTADLAGGGSTSIHVEFNATSSAQDGPAKVIVKSSFGGRSEAGLSVSIGGGAPTTSASANTSPNPTTGGEAPTIGSFIAAAAIGGAAWWRRRNA